MLAVQRFKPIFVGPLDADALLSFNREAASNGDRATAKAVRSKKLVPTHIQSVACRLTFLPWGETLRTGGRAKLR
jgi:hypothetical protein